eukprot:CCRYP_013526-RA/>CCRYP_013526-RA protein AED:0.40 eAED:0.44 QI:0/0/0.5/1/0/0/2/596/66
MMAISAVTPRRSLVWGPLCFVHAQRLRIEYRVILNVLSDQEKGPSADRSGILSQVVLGLPLGWTHA